MLRGELKGDVVVIENGEEVAELESKSYGYRIERGLSLSLVEAAYLLDRGDLEVVDESGSNLSFEELVRVGARYDSNFWVKLSIYSDLRSRGFRVRLLRRGLEFLVERKVKSGEKRYLVIGLREGVRIGFKEIEAAIRRAREARRELVFAIIDKEGNVSYYALERVMEA